MATPPLGDDAPEAGDGRSSDVVAALRAELDALAARCASAERQAEQLADALAEARGELAAHQDHARTASAATPEDSDALGLFDGSPSSGGPGLSGDGSDPGVLPIALGATALVSAMVVLLALLNGRLFSPIGLVMVAVTLILGYYAWQTRVVPLRVRVQDGVVYIRSRGSTHSFDLRATSTRVEVVGRPGDEGWQVRFLRRGLDPFVVDTTSVEPSTFMRLLREVRPEL